MILILKIIACLGFWCLLDELLLLILHEQANLYLAEVLIPTNLHDVLPVNWLGAWFLSIVAYIIGLPFAIGFWIYQLCTIGRDQYE